MSERWTSSGDPAVQDKPSVALPRQVISEPVAPVVVEPVPTPEPESEAPKTGWSPTAWRSRS